MLLIGGISQANAQISYRSKVIKGSDYVEPYDRDVVRQAIQNRQELDDSEVQALIYRAKQYDNNFAQIQSKVREVNSLIIFLTGVSIEENDGKGQRIANPWSVSSQTCAISFEDIYQGVGMFFYAGIVLYFLNKISHK